MMGIFSRIYNSTNSSTSPINWDSTSTLSSGYEETTTTYSIPITSNSKFKITTTTGDFSHGTILLTRPNTSSALSSSDDSSLLNQEAGENELPSYENVSSFNNQGRMRETKGDVMVTIIARYNSRLLYDDSRIGLINDEGTLDRGLVIQTPFRTSSLRNLGINLSFHVTISFPPTVNSLDTFSIDSKNFRILSNQTLSSIHFENFSLSTTNAPVNLYEIKGSTISISNPNILEAITNQTLKHTENSIQVVQKITATNSLTLESLNGVISGTFESSKNLKVLTTNSSIFGIYHAAVIEASTTNASIRGEFYAANILRISNQNGSIAGRFRGNKGISVTTSNAAIEADQFEVGGSLKLLTTHGKIHAPRVVLLPSSYGVELEPELEFVKEKLLAAGKTINKAPVNVLIETSGASINVVYKDHPTNVILSSIIKSSGGGTVTVSHPETFIGSFVAITSIVNTAQLIISPQTSSSGKKIVNYSTKKRNEIAGTIQDEGGEEVHSVDNTDIKNNQINKTMVGTVAGLAEIIIR